MSGVVFLNDVDLYSLGFVATSLPGWTDGIAVNRDLTQVVGRLGAIASVHGAVPPRVIQVEGRVVGDQASDRKTALRAIRAHCLGTVRIRFGDSPTQYIDGYLSDSRTGVQVRGGEFTPKLAWAATLQFTCPDPAFYDVSETVVDFGGTRVSTPMGNLPTGGVVRITGPATDPELRYHNGDGAVIDKMTFTGALDSGEWWEIDLARGRITDQDGENAMGAWSGLRDGEGLIAPDPQDGPVASDKHPGLSVTSGSGRYTYRKAYSE